MTLWASSGGIRPRRISERLVEPYTGSSVSSRARARRWVRLRQRFPDLESMRVVDLGGDMRSWRLSGLRPAELVVVNLDEQDVHEPWAHSISADACDLPRSLLERRFDLVFSNSVIEHVGGHERRRRFAESVHALAPHMWVQTPYRYFPIEPHWLFPGLQWLPVASRVAISRRWPLGHFTPEKSPDGPRDVLRDVLEIELLSRSEMAYYFPDAEIWSERMLGLAKSLVAVR